MNRITSPFAGARAAGLVAFAAGAAINGASAGDPAPRAPRPAAAPALPPSSAGTAEKIRAYRAIVAARPRVPAGYALLSSALQQRSREDADPRLLREAIAAVERGLRIAPQDGALLTQRSSLLLARHQFRQGLAVAERVHRRDPSLKRPYGALIDGYVETGRYRDAARALQEAVDRGPTLSVYTRASYFRELHGDIPGALQALRLAASAGGDAGENVAYVTTLQGNLLLASGRIGAARRSYREALFRVPGYVPALVGLGRLEASTGRFDRALPRLRDAVRRNASPESLTALVEAETAAGSPRAVRSVRALRAVYRELRAAGENTGVERGLFEAQFGDPRLAVQLASQGLRDAPSVRAQDALGYALARAGHARAGLPHTLLALRLGTRDAGVLFRAGMVARDAGRPGLARRWLRRALARNPRFSPLYAPRARRALAALDAAAA